jgi:hypothetical protein
LPLAGCGGLDRGTRDDATTECEALCGLQSQGKGCALDLDACRTRCVADADAFTERCLLAAQDYYTCSAHVIWACPTDPGRPETEDARCAAEEHAWLVCTVTGDVPP